MRTIHLPSRLWWLSSMNMAACHPSLPVILDWRSACDLCSAAGCDTEKLPSSEHGELELAAQLLWRSWAASCLCWGKLLSQTLSRATWNCSRLLPGSLQEYSRAWYGVGCRDLPAEQWSAWRM